MRKSRNRSVQTEAIVLRRRAFKESDYQLTLFTPDLGKIQAIAKGARKLKGRQTGQIELFTRTEVMLYRGKSLFTVTQAQTQDTFRPLRENLDPGLYAAHFAELIDQFAFEQEPMPEVYDLIHEGLLWLCETDMNLKLTARYFELNLLNVMGFAPTLFECAVTGKTILAEDQFFSPAEGGTVSPAAALALSDNTLLPLSLGSLKVLRYMSRHDWHTVKHLNLSDGRAEDLKTLLHQYIVYLLERHLKSDTVLRQFKQNTD